MTMKRQLRAMTVLSSYALLLCACGLYPQEMTTGTVADSALRGCSKPARPDGAAVAAFSGQRAGSAHGTAVLTAFLSSETPFSLVAVEPASAMTTMASTPRGEVASLPSRQVMVNTLALQINQKTSRMNGPIESDPTGLASNKVVRNIMRLVAVRKLDSFRSAVMNSPDSSVMALLDDRSLSALAASPQSSATHSEVKAVFGEAIDQAAATNKPEHLSYDDFKELHHSLLAKGRGVGNRIAQYEAYYFNGAFIDRFGNALPKPHISATVTNEDISGVLTVFLEAIADEIFPNTPVWSTAAAGEKPGKSQGNGGAAVRPTEAKYFPGGSTKPPSVLVFNSKTGEDEDIVALAQPLSDPKAKQNPSGCGMTKLKAEALVYLSGKASTWASGQAGLVLGAVGGANLGLPIALGKISIGDNKTLQTIVQTVLAFAARRGTYEAAWPLLYQIDETQYRSLGEILDVIVFSPTRGAGKDAKAEK
jgi:hypothetical protein